MNDREEGDYMYMCICIYVLYINIDAFVYLRLVILSRGLCRFACGLISLGVVLSWGEEASNS